METPPNVFEPLDRHFHFVCDLAATAANAKCQRFITPEMDSLQQPWPGDGWCFLNPPYGRKIGRWIDKCCHEARLGVRIVALLPSRTDTVWWEQTWMEASGIAFVHGRVKFVDADHGAPFPSAIAVFEPRWWGPPPNVRLWQPGTEWA